MCGIVGAISWDKNFSISEDYIIKMRDTMTHRGPDGKGVWLGNFDNVASINSITNTNANANASANLNITNIALGHRRLAIVDLSNAAIQPMQSTDKNYVISFNGEIYNHREIRTELEKLDKYQWQTDHSDTEVILNAYAEWGSNCLYKLRGMFAFAIWDREKSELFLARDRVGIKPLYYSIHNNRLVFASEIKALLEDSEQTRAVNKEAFFHYLSFLTSPAPMTLFKGINKLPAATWLKVSHNGDIKQQTYWDPIDGDLGIEPSAQPTEPVPSTQSEQLAETDSKGWAKRLINSLREAVKLRKVADVPVGCFLSGGIDSSTITALFTNNNNNNKCSDRNTEAVKTFTIGAKGSYKTYSNELDYAQQMADYAQTDHYEHDLTQKDMLDFLPELIRLQDEPIADPSCVPVYYLSKLAKANGVTVVQSGEGSDELFCGYPGWLMAWKLERLARLPIPRFFKKTLLKYMEQKGWGHQFRHEYLRRNLSNQPVFWGGAEAFSHNEKMKLLSPRLREKFADFTSWEAIKPIWQRYQAHDKNRKTILGWMSYLDLNFRLPELLLMRVDKMTMACSLEARVPFLDHKFVEMAMKVPEELIVGKNCGSPDGKSGNRLKSILKLAVRGIIPDNLIDRKKQGLEMPLKDWFFSEYGEKAREDILEFCEETDLLDKEAVLKFFNRNPGPQAWYLLNVALWWKAYIKS